MACQPLLWEVLSMGPSTPTELDYKISAALCNWGTLWNPPLLPLEKKKITPGNVKSPEYMLQTTQTHDFREAMRLEVKCHLSCQAAQRSQERTRSPVSLTDGFFQSYYWSWPSAFCFEPSCSTDMITVIWQTRSFPPWPRGDLSSITGRACVPRMIPLGRAGMHGSTHKAISINSGQPFPSRGLLQAFLMVYSPRNKCPFFPTLGRLSRHHVMNS